MLRPLALLLLYDMVAAWTSGITLRYLLRRPQRIGVVHSCVLQVS